METQMQTSFIPKKPLNVSPSKTSGGISLFLLLAIIIFIVSLAMAGGVWVWKNSLTAQIAKDKQALVDAKSSYEEGTINPLIRLDDRIKVSNQLLAKHLAVSPVFILLEKNILQTVQLKSLKFAYGTGDKIQITLAGSAQSYEALSKQSDAFGDINLRSFISQPVISDFSPNPDGTISFNFNALIKSGLISYSAVVSPIDTNTATSSTP